MDVPPMGASWPFHVSPVIAFETFYFARKENKKNGEKPHESNYSAIGLRRTVGDDRRAPSRGNQFTERERPKSTEFVSREGRGWSTA